MPDLNNVTVSVVIPVKNEEHKINACLDALLAQSVKPTEIVVIDSGSTDNTVEKVKAYKGIIRLIEIKPSEFNHGLTRNFGVQQTTGEFVLFTVQDAKARDNDWIRKLLEGFTDDNVAAVGGKQVVEHHPNNNPVEWYRPMSKGEIVRYQFTKEEFEKLSPLDRKNVCGLDNVTAMYRRSVLEALPFRSSMEGEDAMWAGDAYRRGYAIAFNPEAIVYHHHHEKMDYVFRRTLLVMYFRYKEFGYVYPEQKKKLMDILREIKAIMVGNSLTMRQKVYWLKYNREISKTISNAHHEFIKALNAGEDNLYARCKELIDQGLKRV